MTLMRYSLLIAHCFNNSLTRSEMYLYNPVRLGKKQYRQTPQNSDNPVKSTCCSDTPNYTKTAKEMHGEKT